MDWTFAFAVVVTSVCAVVRGYSGFGMGLMIIPLLSLALPPADAVIVVLIFGVTVALKQLPGLWRHIDWRGLKLLMPVAILTTPIGTWLLGLASPAVLRLGLSVSVIAVAILFLIGFRLTGTPGKGTIVATGALAGVMNGVAGLSGPPLVFLYLTRADSLSVGRATLIAFFFVTDAAALVFAWMGDIVRRETAAMALLLIPFLLAGVVIGERAFSGTSPERFRQVVLWLLVLTGVVGVIRAISPAFSPA
ncbi:MAG: sulfite exporter TauE/SafE family protein [Alphaproteobacteria bacterium]|nr:sulfite exporter TauE/SafE family protein [Alphaproteobacteria bacterium]